MNKSYETIYMYIYVNVEIKKNYYVFYHMSYIGFKFFDKWRHVTLRWYFF